MKRAQPTTTHGQGSSSRTASEIAQHAANLVGGDRQASHGDKVHNHLNIAMLWNAYLSIRRDPSSPLSPVDAAHMMVLLKISRTQLGAHNADDWTDMTGYAAVAGEIAERDQ